MDSKKSNNEGQFVKRAAEVQLGLWLGHLAKDTSLGTQSVRTRSQKAGGCENCHLYLSHLLVLPVGSKEGSSGNHFKSDCTVPRLLCRCRGLCL